MKLLTVSLPRSPRQYLAVQQEERIAIIKPEELGRRVESKVSARSMLDPGEAFWSIQDLISADHAATNVLRQVAARQFYDGIDIHHIDDVHVYPPFLPTTILCAGSNYSAHNREKAGAPMSGKEPEFFIKTADCVIGQDSPILYDERLTRKLDCETELAIVIGKSGRHIPVSEALDHVFGYSIVNDVTARDLQVRRRPDGFTWYELGRGKVFDCSAPFGPCIVTAEEISDPQDLVLRTRVNGELRQLASTRDMIWSCAQLIHHFSVNLTLKPGMVIITGTPSGTAWSADTELGGKYAPSELHGEITVPAARYALPGDRIESEIEAIGILRNHIV